jgi:chromosome segregation ATPase
MSPTASPTVHDLRRSLSSMQELRRSAIISMLLMSVGLAVLIGGIVYTGDRLGVLEKQTAELNAQITTLKARAAELNAETAILGEQAITLAEQNQQARASLAAVQRQLDSSTIRLQRLSASPNLTEGARAELITALARTEQAENAVMSARNRFSESGAAPARRMDAQTLIVQLFDERASVRVRAYDALMAQHANSPELIPALIAYANTHAENHDGVFNTVIVLNTVPRSQLAAHRELVDSFLARAEGVGRNTRARIAEVRRRIPPA